MAVPVFGPKDRTGVVVVALMDWVGSQPPSPDAIAGSGVIQQAKSRFEAITNTGGEVLGERPLALDGLVPLDPNDYSVGSKQAVWGWATISKCAEEAFV